MSDRNPDDDALKTAWLAQNQPTPCPDKDLRGDK
jgi:hypothetical protein